MKLRVYQRLVILLVLGGCVGIVSLLAQEPVELPEGVAPESEWAYGKHLEQLEEIMKGSDLSAREQQLESFMKKLHPESKILQYYESFFSRTVADYEKAGKTQEASALSSKMLKLFPNSTALLNRHLRDALQKQDHAKTIEIGERLQAIQPAKQTTLILAQSYIATNNAPKAAEYSQKALDAMGPKDGVYFAYWLASYHTGQKKWGQSCPVLRDVAEGLPSGHPFGLAGRPVD